MNLDTQTTFIDWVDVRQNHLDTHTRKSFLVGGLQDDFAEYKPFELLPLVYGRVRARGDELVEDLSEDGNVYYLLKGKADDPANTGFRRNAKKHEGSHSTSVLVECDGRSVRLSGNVGRLDRADNIWNYSLEDTILKASEVCRGHYGLPAFSRGIEYMRDTISEHDKQRGVSHWKWSGAYFAELHVTRNYHSGGEKQAIDAMRAMASFRSARISKGMFGDETLNFGMPTKKGQRLRKAVVVYRKAAEMLAHAKGEEAKKKVKASEEYQFARDVGLIRFECKWGRDYLRDHNLRYWGDADMGKIISLFNQETNFLLTADPGRVNRLVADMPNKVRAAALLWIQGNDLRTLYPRATFFRHVKTLREDFGIDASEPRSGVNNASEDVLRQLVEQQRNFDLQPLACPDWYGLPEVARAA